MRVGSVYVVDVVGRVRGESIAAVFEAILRLRRTINMYKRLDILLFPSFSNLHQCRFPNYIRATHWLNVISGRT